MELWQRFNFSALLDPRLRRLRGHAYKKWFEFVEIAMRGKLKGIVTYLDDEIASTLEISLTDFYRLRQLWTERELLYLAPSDGARRRYAVALWFLPDQTVSKDSNFATIDGRKEDWFTEKALVNSLDMFEDETITEEKDGDTASGAERAFLSKWRRHCRETLQYLPSDAEENTRRRYYRAYVEWKQLQADQSTRITHQMTRQFEQDWYAAQVHKTGRPAPSVPAPSPANPVTPLGNDFPSDSPSHSVTPLGNVTDPIIEREEEKEKENNSIELPRSVTVSSLGNVTEPGNKTIISDSCDSSTPLPPGTDVYDELVILYGFSKDVAQRYQVEKCYTPDYLREKMRWISIEFPGEESQHGGKLRNYIEGKWEKSSRVTIALQKLDKLQQNAEAQRLRAETDKLLKASEEAKRLRQRERDALWAALSPEECAAIELEAFHRVASAEPDLVREYAPNPEDRKRPMIRAMMRPHLNNILEERLRARSALHHLVTTEG